MTERVEHLLEQCCLLNALETLLWGALVES